jgi:hypothetical protein
MIDLMLKYGSIVIWALILWTLKNKFNPNLLINNSMEQCPCWEGTSHTDSPKVPDFYIKWRFIIMFTRFYHWSLSWAKRIQFTFSHYFFKICICMCVCVCIYMGLYGCPPPSQSSPPKYLVLGVFFPHHPFFIASVMLSCYDRLGSPLFLLPSGIHEWIMAYHLSLGTSLRSILILSYPYA